MARAVTPSQEYNQRYYLPRQLEAARARVKLLERKAERFGMHELVTQPECARQ